MNIDLGRSTSTFMIADPLAVLEEGEIHLGFSNVFRDSKSGFNDSMLHDVDVLVARRPAHLPSDIQKACFAFSLASPYSNNLLRYGRSLKLSSEYTETLWCSHPKATPHWLANYLG